MLRTICAAGGGLVLAVTMLAAAATARLAGPASGPGAALAPSRQALAEIPAGYLQAYMQAAATCPGLPWTVLAGIGQVESDQGRDARTSPAGAVGPMQFLPATFTRYDQPVPPGGVHPPSPLDPADAIYAAARDLCANGARDGADIPAAIYSYNHDHTYVTRVLAAAAAYAAPLAAASGATAAKAIHYALAQLGVPYRWGGEGPGGFDCSGLTQAAYAAAGVTIPRTSEQQWLALPHVPLADALPGDLIFFNPGEFIPGLPGHVGIYLGNGQFIDAPHTGTTVRIDALASYPPVFGVARPAALNATSTPTPSTQ
jgi:cell wall-associated NlpC family hydrolase